MTYEQCVKSSIAPITQYGLGRKKSKVVWTSRTMVKIMVDQDKILKLENTNLI